MCNSKKNKMNYKTLFLLIFASIISLSCKIKHYDSYKFETEQEVTIKEKLGYPFGTIVNIEAVVTNGDDIPAKAYQGKYLLKVKAVNKNKIEYPVTMFFTDESGMLETDSLLNILVNKKINLVVYETGQFKGIPEGYDKYQLLRQDFLFGFHHNLIVLAKTDE